MEWIAGVCPESPGIAGAPMPSNIRRWQGEAVYRGKMLRGYIPRRQTLFNAAVSLAMLENIRDSAAEEECE
jgi:hypothetical protein